jgi:hypothetical protein
MATSSKAKLFILIGVIIISCSKKEDPGPIVGSWILKSTAYSDCLNPADNLGEITCTTCITISFTSNWLYGGPGTFGDYKISGNSISINGHVSTFSVTSTTLTLTSKISPSGCTIVQTYARM